MSAVSTVGHERQRAAWQTKLLPLMSAIVVVAAVFFAVMSVIELRDLYERLEQPVVDFDARLEQIERGAEPAALAAAEYLRFRTLASLEAEALQRRYHQATATMLARVWTRQLGFITGMLLALVGAAFILGRLSEEPIKVGAEGQGLKGTLETSSPGLVLAVLGTMLMALTIWVPFGVATTDVNVYLPATLPPPDPRLPQEQVSPGDSEKIQRGEQRLFPDQ